LISSRKTRTAVLNAINAAVLESVMYGVASRLALGPIKEPANLKSAYDYLLKLDNYINWDPLPYRF
jgi:hypothetical protein